MAIHSSLSEDGQWLAPAAERNVRVYRIGALPASSGPLQQRPGAAVTIANPGTNRPCSHSECWFRRCPVSVAVQGAPLHLNSPGEWRYVYGPGDRHRCREKAV